MKKIFAKKIVLSVIIMSMFFSTSDSFANTYRAKVVDYTIRYGENAEDYDDTSSKLNINGTTYLSLRSLASMLDLDIVWDNKEKTISILSDSENPSSYSYNSNNENYVYAKEVNFPIYIDGERKYPSKMEVVVNGTTYLSLRDLANMLNVPINWDSNTRSVTVGEKPLKNKDIAEKMLKLVNDFRAENGVAPLELMPEDIAREYSDLRSREIKEKFSHERPNGENVGDYEPLKNIYAIGENIHAGTRTVNTAFNNWKNSPGHRANMLNTKYTHMYSSQYGKSFVQLFGIRKQNNYNLYQNLQTQIIEAQRQQEELQKQRQLEELQKQKQQEELQKQKQQEELQKQKQQEELQRQKQQEELQRQKQQEELQRQQEAKKVEENNNAENNQITTETTKNISKIIAEKKSQGYMVKKGIIIVENGKTALYLNDLLHLQATNDNGENFNVSVQKIILNGIDVSDYNSKSVTIAIGSHVEVTDKELISYDYEILE